MVTAEEMGVMVEEEERVMEVGVGAGREVKIHRGVAAEVLFFNRVSMYQMFYLLENQQIMEKEDKEYKVKYKKSDQPPYCTLMHFNTSNS